ncbi:AAA family ATPase [Flavobacterium sp. C4GT6]|uniref:AAA family ATPase n=1 Tax=Flavobacterium sp. C4GT6 TaxID=3103818 RepID=UPI002ED0CAFC
MIDKIIFRDKAYQLLLYNDLEKNENIFTTIIGKNGTGKSTLLSSIVSELLNSYNDKFFNENELGFKFKPHSLLSLDIPPQSIIAVSSSPFDKFPLTRKLNDIESYTYLGLRDLSSMNFGLSYMSKIISSLIESIYEKSIHWDNIAEVLNYLGYKDSIKTRFSANISKSSIEEILYQKGPYYEHLFTKINIKTTNKRFFLNTHGEIDREKYEYFKYLLYKLLHSSFEYRYNKSLNITLNENQIALESELSLSLDEIIFLIHSGVFKLRDIGLVKLSRTSTYSIKDSSSGEQSVILSILGIASKITNNSIICIDEPEVCLHPEWQEKYIQILTKTFSKFKNCHFIIATHSPQIISKLSPKNCFVISMEDASIKNAKEYINNSIDYQLVNVFKSPGYKNEYLSRLAFTIFSKVSKNKIFDSDDIKNYEILKKSYKSLEDQDPVKELTSVLFELYKKYA